MKLRIRTHGVHKTNIIQRFSLFIAALVIASTGLSSLAYAAPGDYIWHEAGTGVAGYTRYYSAVAGSADGVRLVAADSGGGANGYIYTSTDAGATWTQRTGAGSRSWSSVTSSSDGTKLAATYSVYPDGGYIYTSTDAGATWTQQSGLRPVEWESITSSSDGTKLAAVARGDSVYTSTDSGVTWTAYAVKSATYQLWSSIASSADGMKLAVVSTGDYTDEMNVIPGDIYTSNDFGATWTAHTVGTYGNWSSITSSSDGTKLAAVSTSGDIYLSTDAGATWVVKTIEAGSRQWSGIASSADGTKLAATVEPNGYIYTSIDSGVTWVQQVSAGSRSWRSIASSADGTKLVAGVSGGSLYLGTLESLTTTTIAFPALVPSSNSAPSSTISGATLSATSATCYTLDNSSVKTLGTTGVGAPTGVTLLGGVAYSLTCTTAGGTADASLVLNAHYTDPSQLRVYKQDPTTKQLTDITNKVTLANQVVSGQTKTVISYTLTDGAAFDEDNATNSTIVDPLFIGVAEGAKLASTGMSVWNAIAISAAAMLGAVLVLAYGVKRRHMAAVRLDARD